MAVIHAAIRNNLKKSATKTLRAEGRIPSVVYGKKIGNEPISVESREIGRLFRREGRNALITLDINDKQKCTVMAHEVQFNHLKGSIQHIDFLEVDVNQEMEAVVPVTVKGIEQAEQGGAVVNHQLSELAVRALPNAIPNAIEVDVSGLSVGDNIRIGDIPAGEGYTLVGNPEEVVVSVSYADRSSDTETEEEAPAEEETPAE